VSLAVFGPEYAATYDALYEDKDYLAECDVVERVFAVYAQRQVRRVLDLGCGTGGHAAPLAARGYEVVGVDRSPAMLERARARGSEARFQAHEIAGLDLGESFDAVLMMFAVFSYQTANADVQTALASVRRHLRPGGLFFADLWYGPAVLRQRPSERVKVASIADGQIIRVASGDLDARRNLCTVRYHVWQIASGQLVAEVREQHPMRYFFLPELELMFESAGLELLRLGSFPEIDDEATEATWNVAVIARAA
jgi:SAM-dependent methyltransferase